MDQTADISKNRYNICLLTFCDWAGRACSSWSLEYSIPINCTYYHFSWAWCCWKYFHPSQLHVSYVWYDDAHHKFTKATLLVPQISMQRHILSQTFVPNVIDSSIVTSHCFQLQHATRISGLPIWPTHSAHDLNLESPIMSRLKVPRRPEDRGVPPASFQSIVLSDSWAADFNPLHLNAWEMVEMFATGKINWKNFEMLMIRMIWYVFRCSKIKKEFA